MKNEIKFISGLQKIKKLSRKNCERRSGIRQCFLNTDIYSHALMFFLRYLTRTTRLVLCFVNELSYIHNLSSLYFLTFKINFSFLLAAIVARPLVGINKKKKLGRCQLVKMYILFGSVKGS